MCALAHPFDAATMAALGAKVGKGSYAPINVRLMVYVTDSAVNDV